jgi:hypothetical protein
MTSRSPEEKRNMGQEKSWAYRVHVVRAKVDGRAKVAFGSVSNRAAQLRKHIFNDRHCPPPCIRGLVRCSHHQKKTRQVARRCTTSEFPILGTSLVSSMHTAQHNA